MIAIGGRGDSGIGGRLRLKSPCVFPTDPSSHPSRGEVPPDTEAEFDQSAAHAGAAPPTGVPMSPVRAGKWGSRFEELTVELGGDVVEFQHVRNNTPIQHVSLFAAALAFTGVVVFVMPLLGISGTGRVLWVVAGIVVLTLCAMVMQTRVQSTRLRLDRVGLSIDQGTELDKESIVILWADLLGVDLEPVSETDGRKGMCLRLRTRDGESIDTLGGIGVGELNDVRRVIQETLARHRQNPTRGT